MPAKQTKKNRLCIRLRPERPNRVWSCDFVEARTQDGRYPEQGVEPDKVFRPKEEARLRQGGQILVESLERLTVARDQAGGQVIAAPRLIAAAEVEGP